MTQPSTAPNDTAPQPTVGLALGGGGARGLAHIVVLEAFDELNLKPNVISGTSIGALIGAAYASGLSAAQIRTHAHDILVRRSELLGNLVRTPGTSIQKVLGALQLRSAILKPDALLEIVLPIKNGYTFRDLEIPLRVIATDFGNQSEVVLQDGPLREAIAASIAVPAIFSPVTANGMTLVDGGLVNPLPFDTLAGEADITVAVDVLGSTPGPDAATQKQPDKPPGAFRTLLGSFQILQNTIVREKLKTQQPDIFIEIESQGIHAADFFKFEKILEAAQPAKEQLKRRLSRIMSAQTLPTAQPDTDNAPTPEIATSAATKENKPSATSSQAQPQPRKTRLADRILNNHL